jgi:hypothetical protein
MLWAMLGMMVAFWAVFATPFGLVLRRRRQRRRVGANPPGGFGRLNSPP